MNNVIFNIIDDFVYIFVYIGQIVFKKVLALLNIYKKRRSNKPIPENFKESPSYLKSIWIIKELYDKILINSSYYLFIELLIVDSSDNGFEFLLTEFPSVIISQYIATPLIEDVQKNLKEKLNALYEERLKASNKAFSNALFLDFEIKKEEERLKRFLSKDRPFLIRTCICINHKEDIKKLKLFSYIFRIDTFPLYFKQLSTLKSFLFLNSEQKHQLHLIGNLAPANIFLNYSQPKIEGIYIGHEKNKNIPVFENIFKNENYNSVIIAKSGAGKSFLASLIIKRLLLTGVNVIVFDSEGEYSKLCNSFHGINIGENKLSFIDRQMESTNNVLYIKNMLPLIFESSEELVKAQYQLEEIPNYSDFFKKLNEMDHILKMKILNNINLSGQDEKANNFLNFYIPSDNLKIPLYKIIYYALYRDTCPTILFIDEAHKVMDDPYIAKLIRQAAKRGRKYGLGICVISQDIIDFIQNKWSKAVISNATLKFLLKQESINLPLIKKIFNIEEDEFLKNAQVGEGLFIKNEKVQKVVFDDY